MNIIIDTNVWLDLVVFSDPRVASLRRALEHKTATCHRTPYMMSELREVVSRPMFGLSLDAQRAALEEANSLSQHAETAVDHSQFLLCKDPDDQMFLDLALALKVNILISKDRALLRLASRATKYNLKISATWPN
jgi:putative PIN family toxin of toxin-antitoxin system